MDNDELYRKLKQLKIEDYTVTPDENEEYAIFNTNHFSIYTLAESKNQITEQNPNTYDGIMSWIVLGLISIGGIAGAAIYRKKQSI